LLRGAAFLVTALAVIGAPARRLPAQVKESEEETGSFYGTVRSAELRPLAAATVETPELGRIAVTNQKGEFYLRDLPLGAHDVQVGYLGLSYNAVIEVSAGEVAIKHYKLDLTLAELEPLVVEAQAAAGMKMREFVRREARSAGLFLDRDDIDRLGPLVTSDMLSGQAGVESQDYANGRRSVSIGRGLGNCRPSVIVDGSRVQAFGMDDFFPQHIEAIEVYKSVAQTPVRYRSDNNCGTIVIWTRETFD
jgi:hypothetical protein